MSPRRTQPPSSQPSLAAAARLHLRPPPAQALPPGLCLRRLSGDVDSAPTPPLTRCRRLQLPLPPAECRRLVSTPPPRTSSRPLPGCCRCLAAAIERICKPGAETPRPAPAYFSMSTGFGTASTLALPLDVPLPSDAAFFRAAAFAYTTAARRGRWSQRAPSAPPFAALSRFFRQHIPLLSPPRLPIDAAGGPTCSCTRCHCPRLRLGHQGRGSPTTDQWRGSSVATRK